MFISVEISSFNRWHVLRLVLEGLARQTHPLDQFEVVVSDDGSADGTPDRIAEFALHAPYRLTLLRNDHVGCGVAHNNGILQARGPIVLMIADDILPEPGLLAAHARMHELHPDPAVGIVGRLEQSAALPRTPLQQVWNGIVGAMFPRDRVELDYRDFWVNNLSFKKDFMVRNGMFNSWPPASNEDVELGYRLQQRGMRLLFCDDARAAHHHTETIDSVTRRGYAVGYNWQLFEKHVPELWTRARSGSFRPGDGMKPRVRFALRNFLRAAFFNRLTVPTLLVPLIRRSERAPWLMPVVRAGTRGAVTYYFRKGILDSRRGLPRRIPGA